MIPQHQITPPVTPHDFWSKYMHLIYKIKRYPTNKKKHTSKISAPKRKKIRPKKELSLKTINKLKSLKCV